jgi:site-specific DNA recombinase
MTTSRSASLQRDPVRRAAIYTRISKDEEGDELGVARQEKLCRELLGRVGWETVGVYRDDNLSAFKRKRRPEFDRLTADIRAGVVDAVAVYNPDRMSRDDLRGLEDLIDLLNSYDVAVETVRSGSFDLTTSHGRAQARMAGVWARLESEKMSERLSDKHAEIVAAGKPNGGRRPLGYHNDRVTPTTPDSFPCAHPLAEKCNARPGEDEIVREIIGRVAAGETLTRIAADLNARGAATSTGGRFTLTNLRQITLNGRYVAHRFHNGIDVGAADWPALVDDATWMRARALLTAPERARRRAARRFLLTGGMAVCGKCGNPLRSKPNHTPSGPVPIYGCRPRQQGGCGGVSIRADALEQLVAEAVIAAVESASFAKALRARQGGDRKAAAMVEKITTELDELEQAKETGAIDLREYMRFRDAARARLAEAQSRMASDTTEAAVGRYAGQQGALRAVWEDPATTLDRKQAFVRAAIKPVIVAPVGKHTGNRFHGDRVKIERAF